MDEYAKFIWERRPDFKNSDPGDVSDQVDEAKKISTMIINFFDDKRNSIFEMENADVVTNVT